ncbi:MAG: HDIG domain-containing protein [Elusimicrobia bacterium]|nr:HDIG domain-containing protein [Elusimicrobiota bacterium]
MNWRAPVKKVLEKILKTLEKSPQKKAVTRNKENILNKEIKLPPYLVSTVSIIVFFLVLLFEIGFSWTNIIGLVIFIGIIFVFFVLYLTKVEKDIVNDSESIILLGVIFVSAILLMELFKEWLSPIATPVAAFAVLVGLLISIRLAIISGIILSLILAVLNNFSFEYFLIHLISSVTGIVFISTIRNRGNIIKLGLKITAANVLAVMIIHLFKLWPVITLGINIGWGILGGFTCAILILVTLPYLEIFFSRVTNIKLLELADFNQPLLKQLMVEAPGTYHHSLITASMAEQAAGAIGEDSLLARVGAYYHDVGKLSHPEYFIENQEVGENPHTTLTPPMSGLIISSHVKEGVALAKQYKLDKAIVDCIQEHHGTSLMHYFYHRAVEQSPETKNETFRYPGPKPRSKVTAILMIADAVEASSRTLEDHSAGKLKDAVEKVINNKFIDGQFSECPITLHDLSTIAESMVLTLGGIYHARIKYKDTPDLHKKQD